MRRLALDLGKHLGWATNCKAEWRSGFIDLENKGKPEEQIYNNFYLLLLSFDNDYNFEQIYYELPYVRNRNNDGLTLYGLLGVLKLVAYQRDIQLVPVNPMTLKCQVTGSGRADKADMIEIASHAMDKTITSSDEADAVCIMLYAEFGEEK